MAQRPDYKQNWQGRSFQSFGPKFRLDMNNPQMGQNGTDVYTLYAVTDEKDICLTGLSEGGIYKIYNDQSIEIVAGYKAKGNSVDICITGKNGDIWITAEKNGKVKIRASHIVIDADETLDLVAGKNINVTCPGKINLKSNEAVCDALTGNLAPKGSSFGELCFAGTYVNSELITSTFSGGTAGGESPSINTTPPEDDLFNDESLVAAANPTTGSSEAFVLS